MAAKSFMRLVSGKLKAIQAVVTSTGATNDGDIPALDSTGKLDITLMPVGVGADVETCEAGEALSAGNYVNFYDDLGVKKVRLADNTNGRDAHGFVKAAVTIGSPAIVYFEGSNNDFTGLTVGARQYLGVAGGIIDIPLVPVTDAGKIHQFLGVAVNSTSINTDIDDCMSL